MSEKTPGSSERSPRRQRLDAYEAEYNPDEYWAIEPGPDDEPDRYLAIGVCEGHNFTFFAVCSDERDGAETFGEWMKLKDPAIPYLFVDLDTGASTSMFETLAMPKW